MQVLRPNLGSLVAIIWAPSWLLIPKPEKRNLQVFPNPFYENTYSNLYFLFQYTFILTLTLREELAVISVADVSLETLHLFYFPLDQEWFGEEARREKQKHRKRNSHSQRPREIEVKSERDKDIQKVTCMDTCREPLRDSEKGMYAMRDEGLWRGRLRKGKGSWDVGLVKELWKAERRVINLLTGCLIKLTDLISEMLQTLLNILRFISLIWRNTVTQYNERIFKVIQMITPLRMEREDPCFLLCHFLSSLLLFPLAPQIQGQLTSICQGMFSTG